MFENLSQGQYLSFKHNLLFHIFTDVTTASEDNRGKSRKKQEDQGLEQDQVQEQRVGAR